MWTRSCRSSVVQHVVFEQGRERERAGDVSLRLFLLVPPLLCARPAPPRSCCGYGLAARVVDSFGAVKSPESVRFVRPRARRRRWCVRFFFPPALPPPRRWCSWLSQQKQVAFWLILPVVICLSQRLSHACLSSHPRTVKPRMAH